jgi:hypothetical protein
MATSTPLGAISAGVRYQVRFFWRHALAMLAPSPRVSKVVLEHRGVDAVDDVVVYYTPPGVNDRGATVGADFHQLKFHVAKAGVVDHDVVIDPAWTGTKLAMLRRFADAWTKIAPEHPSARLSLVTNWPWDPASSLSPLIRDGGRLSDEFFASGPKSSVGKIRARWRDACGLPEIEFAGFVRALRLSTSAVSQDDADLWLNDRCQLAGLVPVAQGVDHSPYDDLGMRLIESGRTEHTPESLRALVEKQGLVAAKDPPFKSTFAVRSFARFAHVPETDGACVVDLTDLFDRRQPRTPDAWAGAVRERLEGSLSEVGALGQPVHVALDAHLSIAWYAGYMLDPKAGIRVLLRQRIKGKGIELWDVAAPRRPDGAADWLVTSSEAAGEEVAVVISVTHAGLADATRYVRESLPAVGMIIHAALTELGPQAVQDGPHARWLADELIRLLGAKTAELRPKQVHVFPACPASLAFLLGQEARVLGPTTVYEFDFGSATRTYRPGMTTLITE